MERKTKHSISYLLVLAMLVMTFFSQGITAFAIEKDSAQQDNSETPYIEGEALILLDSDLAGSLTDASGKDQTGELSISAVKQLDEELALDKASGLAGDITVEASYDFGSYEQDQAGNVISDSAASAEDTETVNVNIVKVSSDSMSTEKLVKELNRMSGTKRYGNKIQIAAPNFKVQALDTGYDGEQYAKWLWGMDKSNADAQWKLGSDPENEKVIAIVDTGVDFDHPELKDRMWSNPFSSLGGTNGYNFVTYGNQNISPKDDNGHGTHCAGIIGGALNNEGIAGISSGFDDVKIMALKFLDEEGSGTTEGALASYAYISKAQEKGVNVIAINNSWGSSYKGIKADDFDDELDDENSMFEKVFNAMGSEGALSVCAAGNAAADNDEDDGSWGFSPCNANSDYVISVAATANGGEEFASFSNYGEKTVDLAAPGGDILSSVAYDCYNPSLYFNDESLVSHEKDETPASAEPDAKGFEAVGGAKDSSYDFEFSGDETAEEFLDNARIITKDYDGPASGYAAQYAQWEADGADMSKKSPEMKIGFTSENNENFKPVREGAEGCALKWEVGGRGDDTDVVVLGIPYALKNSSQPYISAMLRGLGPDYTFMPNLVLMVEGSADMDYKALSAIESSSQGAYLNTESNTWDHCFMQTNKKASETAGNAKTRYCYLILYAPSAGTNTLFIDDFAVSAPDPDKGNKPNEEAFGRYDFYSGTSMATPYVTGAVASTVKYIESKTSKDIALTEGEKAIAAKDMILASVGKADFLEDKVATGGYLDLSDANLQNAISIFAVKEDSGKLIINGTGLDKADKIKVEVAGKEADSVSDSGAFTISPDEATLDTDKLRELYPNRVITVTAEGGNISSRTVILTKGKTAYKVKTAALPEALENGGLFTDGRHLYNMYFEGSYLIVGTYDGQGSFEDTEYGVVFKGKNDDDENDNGNDESESGSTTFITSSELGSKPVMIGSDCYAIIAGNEGTDDAPAFSRQYKLLKLDMSEDVPEEDAVSFIDYPGKSVTKTFNAEHSKYDYAETVGGQALGAYNGKLYMMGGYDFSKKQFAKYVYVYDPKTKKWTEGPSLPVCSNGDQGRYGGQALQSGKVLIYALGASESSQADPSHPGVIPPSILEFDGSKWTEKKRFEVNYGGDTGIIAAGGLTPEYVELGNKKYYVCDGDLNLIKGGVLMTGTFFDGIGDTVIYNSSKGELKGSKYNFITKPDQQWMETALVGGTLYGIGYDGKDTKFYQIYDSSQWNSGLLKVSCNTSKKTGTVSGANKSYMPGTPVKLQAKAAKKHYFKTLKAVKAVNGKDLTVKAKAKTQPKTSKAITFTLTSDVTVKATFGNYVTKIKLSKTKASVEAGKSLKLKAKTILPKNADNKAVTWKTSNKKYATVSSKGVVKTKKAGKGKKVTITCMAKDGSKVKAKCKIKIK